MKRALSLPKILSLSNLLTSPKPREAVKNELIRLLEIRLKKLGIVWNSKTFAKGLSNPELPKELLSKLENLVSLAEASGWDITNSLKFELDETIEDIESFNPSFRRQLDKELAQAEEDWKKGLFIPGEEIEKRLGIK